MDSNSIQGRPAYPNDENNHHSHNIESLGDFKTKDTSSIIGEHGELLCKEHMYRQSLKEKATKWCFKCQLQTCLECAFEFHTYYDHEKKDVINLEEFINSGITQLKTLDDAFTITENETGLFKRAFEDLNQNEKKFIHLEEENIKQLESLRGKIDAIEEEIHSTFRNVRNSFQEVFSVCNKNEALNNYRYARMKLSEQQKIYCESTKDEKLEILKSLPKTEENLSNLLFLAENEIQNLKKSKSFANGATSLIEKSLKNALFQLSIDSYVKEIEKNISSISRKLKRNYIFTNKDIEQSSKDLNSKKLTEVINNSEYNQHVSQLTELSKISKMPVLNPQKVQKIDNDFHFPLTADDFIKANPKEYEYLISLKERSVQNEKKSENTSLGELNIITRTSPDNIMTIKIEETFFKEKRKIAFPPDYCRYVNLGAGILITGGIDQVKNSSVDLCWLLLIEYIDKKYTVSISSYTPMKRPRERHNLAYLDNFEQVIACSGFYVKSCEILSLKASHWKMLPDLAHARANATICYINQSIVYCLGGFEVVGKDCGKYHGDIERLDMYHKEKGWTLINLEHISHKSDLKQCAMGVIHVAINKVILVGGYNGKNYLEEANLVEFTDNSQGIKEITHLDQKLQKGIIFSSSSQFIRIKNKAYNFDFGSKLIKCDLESNEFSNKK